MDAGGEFLVEVFLRIIGEALTEWFARHASLFEALLLVAVGIAFLWWQLS